MKILYFSLVNWKWIKQRPQFLAEYFCKLGNTVEYLALVPLLKASRFKGRSKSGLKIHDTYVIPLSSKFKLIENINIAYIKAKLSKDYDVIVLTHPFQYNYITKKLKKNCKIVYDCMDNISFFEKGKISERIYREEERLCRTCSKIITSSNYLKNRIITEYNIQENKIEVIKNAVDKSFFCKKSFDLQLNSPNLVYLGTISEWIDFDNITRYAKDNPNVTIYLIGPCQIDMKHILQEIENIVYIPPITHEEVINYIYAADIVLIPFIVNDLIRGVDPVKMYEYLSLNKEVVSSFWDELSEYKNYANVHFYDSYMSFSKSIEDGLSRNHEKRDSIYDVNFLNNNSWEERARRFIQVICKIEE